MSRSAVPATQNHMIRLSKPPKVTAFAALANVPATGPSRRTTAKATAGEHTFVHRPPKINENPAARIPEKYFTKLNSHLFVWVVNPFALDFELAA